MKLQEKFIELRNQKRGILATNFYNYETLEGVLLAAKETDQPLILQLTKNSIDYMGLQVAFNLAKTMLDKHGVEGWIHLDHGNSYELAAQCLDVGFDSVMIDASERPFKDNIAITSKVVKLAKEYGASVEAELGYIAKLGQNKDQCGFTSPEEAKQFVDATGVDADHVDLGVCEFGAQALAKAPHRKLGGAVGGLHGHADEAEHAREVDDAALAGALELRQEELASVDHPPKVDVDDPTKVLEADVAELAGHRDSGIVDQQVHAAVLVVDGLGEVTHGLLVGDVDLVGANATRAPRAGQLGGLGEADLIAVGQGEGTALLGERQSQGASDPAGGSGEDDDLLVEVAQGHRADPSSLEPCFEGD